MSKPHVTPFMSRRQAYIQEPQWVIRHLQYEIAVLQTIVKQLSQEVDPDIIIIEVEPILDNQPV